MAEYESSHGQTPPTNHFGTPITPSNPYAPPPQSPYAQPQTGTASAYGPLGTSVVPAALPIGRPRGRSAAANVGIIAGIAVPVLLAVAIAVAVVAPQHGHGTVGGGVAGGAGGGVPVVRADGFGSLPAVLTAVPPASTHSVVTPVEAKQIVTTLWFMRTEAMNARSLPAIAQVDSGSAYAGDRVRLCDCGHEGYGPVQAIQVYVNRQLSYPAMVMAEVELAAPSATAYPQRAYLAVRRDSRSQPWRIDFEALVGESGPTTSDPGAVDTDGYSASPTASERGAALRLPFQLAAYWQMSKDNGKPTIDGSFGPGTWTDQKDVALAAHRNGHIQANGLIGRYRFWTDSRDPVYMTRLPRGETFACALIHRSVVEKAPRGGFLVQDVNRTALGPQVTPGRYRSLDLEGVSQTCFVQAFPGPTYPVRVSGGNEEYESTVVARK
jgi:hypothetical protein